VGWLLGESFIVDHARRSVFPKRLANILLQRTENVINGANTMNTRNFHRSADDRPGDSGTPESLVVAATAAWRHRYQNTSKVILQTAERKKP